MSSSVDTSNAWLSLRAWVAVWCTRKSGAQCPPCTWYCMRCACCARRRARVGVSRPLAHRCVSPLRAPACVPVSLHVLWRVARGATQHVARRVARGAHAGSCRPLRAPACVAPCVVARGAARGAHAGPYRPRRSPACAARCACRREPPARKPVARCGVARALARVARFVHRRVPLRALPRSACCAHRCPHAARTGVCFSQRLTLFASSDPFCSTLFVRPCTVAV